MDFGHDNFQIIISISKLNFKNRTCLLYNISTEHCNSAANLNNITAKYMKFSDALESEKLF